LAGNGNVFPLLIHADLFYDNLRADKRVGDVLERLNLKPWDERGYRKSVTSISHTLVD
jgi:hypothetical protein